MSLATQEKADERMSHLLQDSYSATRSLLARNKALLDRLTQALLGNSPDSPGGNGVPSGGNGAPPGGKGAPVWRSDGSVGTVYGSEVCLTSHGGPGELCILSENVKDMLYIIGTADEPGGIAGMVSEWHAR